MKTNEEHTEHVETLINAQKVDELLALEVRLLAIPADVITMQELEVLSLIHAYFKARKEILSEINERSWDVEGPAIMAFECYMFKAIARVQVLHKFSKGSFDIPDAHDIDLDILELNITLGE